MTWLPLLLADASPNLRLLVLRELLGRPPGDPEVVVFPEGPYVIPYVEGERPVT